MQPSKHLKGWKIGIFLATLALGVFLVRSTWLLSMLGIATAIAFCHSVWFSPWVMHAEGFPRGARRLFGCIFVSILCFAVFKEMWCIAKEDDSRLESVSPSDVTVTLVFHLPDAGAAELEKLNGEELIKKMFCQTDRMHFEVVLVPGDNPISWSPLNLIVEASNLEESCDLKTTLAALDDNGNDHRLNTTIKVVGHDWNTVTLETKIFGYELDSELHTRKRFVMGDYGRRLPIYGYSSQPLSAGQESFSLPMGIPLVADAVKEAKKIAERVDKYSFKTVDVTVRPNPEVSSLSSSWSLQTEDAGLDVTPLTPPAVKMRVLEQFFQVDDRCWLSSLFGS
jgi:hypothetical protein